MRNTFANDPNYILGVQDPMAKPPEDIENRTWGQLATDVAIDVAAPVMGAVRGMTQAVRAASPVGGEAEAIDIGAGQAQRWLEEQRSPRSRALSEAKIFPGYGERSFWEDPVSGAAQAALPMVVPGVAAAKIGAAVGMAGFGALGASESISRLRDFADTEPLDNLKKSEVFQSKWREFNGDERAARDALFKEMTDTVSVAADFTSNALTFGALSHGMASPVKSLIQRVLWGTGEGALFGSAGGLSGAYSEQLGRVRAGTQEAIDTRRLVEAAEQGLTIAPAVAALHAFAPRAAPRAPEPDQDLKSVVGKQMQPTTTPPAQPPTPPSTPPPGGAATPTVPPTGPGPAPPAPGAAPGGPAPRPLAGGLEVPPGVSPAGPTVPPAGAAMATEAPPRDTTGLTAMGKGMGSGAVGSFYDTMFDALQRGKSTMGGVAEPGLSNPDVKMAFRRGQIRSPEQLRVFANAHPELFARRPAPPVEPAPEGAAPLAAGPTSDAAMIRARDLGVTEDIRELSTGMSAQEISDVLQGRMTPDQVSQVIARLEMAAPTEQPPMQPRPVHEEPLTNIEPRPVQPQEAPLREAPAAIETGAPPVRLATPEVTTAQQPTEEMRRGPTQAGKEQVKRPGQEPAKEAAQPPTPRPTPRPTIEGTAKEVTTTPTGERVERRIPAERPETLPALMMVDDAVHDVNLVRQAPVANREGVLEHEILLDDGRRLKVPADQIIFDPAKRPGPKFEQYGVLSAAMAAELRRRIAEQQAQRGEGEAQEKLQAIRERAGRTAVMGPVRPGEVLVTPPVIPKAPKKLQTMEKSLQRDIAKFKTKPGSDKQWQELRRRARSLDAQLREAGMAPRFVEALPKRPAGAAEREEARARAQPRVERGRVLKPPPERVGPTAPAPTEPLAPARGWQRLAQVLEKRRELAAQREAKITRQPVQVGEAIAEPRRPSPARPTELGTAAQPVVLTSQEAQTAAWKAALTPAKIEAARLATARPVEKKASVVAEAIEMYGERHAFGKVPYDLKEVIRRVWEGSVDPRTGEKIPGLTELQRLAKQSGKTEKLRSRVEQIREDVINTTIRQTLKDEFESGEKHHIFIDEVMGEVAQRGLHTVEEATEADKTRLEEIGKQIKAIEERAAERGGYTDAEQVDLNHLNRAAKRLSSVIVGERREAVLGYPRLPRQLVSVRGTKRSGGREGLTKEERERMRAERVAGRAPDTADVIREAKKDARLRNIAEDYEKRVQKWWEIKERQREAAIRLLGVLDKIVANVEKAYTTTKLTNIDVPDKEGQRILKLPTGKVNQEGRVNYTSAEATERYDYQNYLVQLMRAREALRIGLQGSDPNPRNRPREFMRYMGRLDTLLRNFAVHAHFFNAGRMDAIREDMRVRSQVTSEVYMHQLDRPTPEGKTPDLSEAEKIGGEYVMHGGSRATQLGRNIVEESADNVIDSKMEADARGETASGRRAWEEQQKRWERIRQETGFKSQPRRLGMAQFDQDGLPLHGKRWIEFEPYQEDWVDEAHSLLVNGSVDHPAIEDPEPNRTVLDRVKGLMVEGRGIEANVPNRYVTPEFLDLLARVNQNTQVVHAPTEVTSGARTDAPAHYQVGLDRIVLPNDASDAYYIRAALHENVHAATVGRLNTDPKFLQEVHQDLQTARDWAKASLGYDFEYGGKADLYGLTNPSEFLAEAASNQRFRDFLGSIPTDKPTIAGKLANVLNSLFRSIRNTWRRLTGSAEHADTALDVLFYDRSSVLGRVDRMVEGTVRQAERLGRNQDPNRFYDDTTYGMAGGRFLRTVGDNFRSWGIDKVDRVHQAWETRGERRAGPLIAHSLFDLTRRGEPAWQEKTRKIFQISQLIDGERNNIIRHEDQPMLDRVQRFLRSLTRDARGRVENFLYNESHHGAYADEDLYTGRNRHISRTSLADEQTRNQHAAMQAEYQALARTRGFAEARQTLHDYFHRREEAIRDDITREMWRHSDIIPNNLTTAQRERALDRLVQYTLNPRSMAPAERANLARGPKIKEIAQNIRRMPELHMIAGPYLPHMRHGTTALFGRFNIPTPQGAERVPGRIDPKTGLQVDEGVFRFNTEQEAKDFIRQVSDQLGLTQTAGHVVYIDRNTGKRAVRYDEAALEAARLADPNVKNTRLGPKEAEARIAAGAPIDRKYQVQFNNRLLEYHDSPYEARRSSARWRAQFTEDQLRMRGVENVHTGDGKQDATYVSDAFQKGINRLEQSTSYKSLTDAEQAEIKTMLNLFAAKAAMHRGVKQRYLPRGYVTGESRDIIRNTMEYSGASAGFLAKTRHRTAMRDAVRDARVYHEQHGYDAGDRDRVVRAGVLEEMLLRVHTPTESMVDNAFSRGVDRLARLSMLDKLFGISYFGTNATEPSLLGAPMVAGRRLPGDTTKVIGVRRALGAMVQAYRMLGTLRMLGIGLRDVKTAARGGHPDPNAYMQRFEGAVAQHRYADGLRQLLREAAAENIFEGSAGVEYQRVFLTHRGTLDTASDWLQNVFQAANSSIENTNRFVNLVMSYIADRDAGRSHAEATEFAKNILYRASGQYSSSNTPRLFKAFGPLGMLAFQFKKYPQRIMANYIEGAAGALRAGIQKYRGVKNLNAEQMAEYRDNVARAKQLGYMLAVQGTVAGMLGMPTEIFSIPVNALNIMGVIPYNWEDAQAGVRRMLARFAGPQAAELISHGMLRATGVDVASRLSQSDMILWGSPGSTKVNDLRGSVAGILLGAGGGYAGDFVSMSQKASEAARAYWDGNGTEGFRLAREAARLGIPFRAVTDLIDATIRSQPEGMQTVGGRQMRRPYEGMEAVIRATGFTPAREAESQEARRVVKRQAMQYEVERKRLIDLFVQGNPAERQAVMRRINQFNQGRPPEQQISTPALFKAIGTRTKAEGEGVERLGLKFTSQTLPFLKQAQIYQTQ